MTDPIADMLTRIRNAIMAKKQEVEIPFSRVKFSIAKILENEGFIKEAKKLNRPGAKMAVLSIKIKYKGKQPVIRGIKKVSRPSQRVYAGYKDLPKILPSLGILIISTSKGFMTNQEAKNNKIGGEIICEIY